MKTWRRWLTLSLAMVMTLALMAPCARAAGDEKWWESTDISVWLNLADGHVQDAETSFKLRKWSTETSWDKWNGTEPVWDTRRETYTRNTELQEVTGPCVRLPLGAEIEAHPKLLGSIHAYSDPDGDGIYDERLFRIKETPAGSNSGTPDTFEVLPVDTASPLTDKASAIERPRDYYLPFLSIHNGIDNLAGSGLGGCVKLTSDYLTKLFGPNTLVMVGLSLESGQQGSFWYLLTGEKADPAHLEKRNTTVTKGGYVASKWAVESVNQAYDNGLMPDFYTGTVRTAADADLTRDISRAQFAAVTVKLYEAMSGQKAPAAASGPFTDTSDPVINQAFTLGFVTGMSDTIFAPSSPVTREQAALMLSRVYTKLGGEVPKVSATTFADDAAIHGWARDAVAFMSGKEIVNGMGENRFEPASGAAIQQALVIALRMFQNLK